jgi:hypothetical protein
MEQNPVEDLYYITVKDLTKEGVKWWKKTPVGEKQNVTFCVLCQAKVKAVKVLAQAMKVAEKESKRKSAETTVMQRRNQSVWRLLLSGGIPRYSEGYPGFLLKRVCILQTIFYFWVEAHFITDLIFFYI